MSPASQALFIRIEEADGTSALPAGAGLVDAEGGEGLVSRKDAKAQRQPQEGQASDSPILKHQVESKNGRPDPNETFLARNHF
jgi:hypothetical protein